MVSTLRVHAPLAQLVERHTCNMDVIGSNPVGGSNKNRVLWQNGYAAVCKTVYEGNLYAGSNPVGTS